MTAIVVIALPRFLPDATRIADFLQAEVREFTPEIFSETFRSFPRIIALMSMGIAVRKIAPLLNDKWNDPAVVVVSPDFRYAIPLLGGHHGANELAKELAGLGLTPVITTATEATGRDSVEAVATRNGCGPGLLTEQAIAVIAGATHIYGSDRAIGIARPHISPSCTVKTIDDFKSLRKLGGDAVVLSTGDPLLAGLGYLDGEVVPGISSLQIALARLHIPLARVAIVVAHGTGHEKAIDETLAELARKRIIFLLTDPKFDLTGLHSRLEAVIPPVRIAVCEDLGYPSERIVTGSLRDPPRPRSDLYTMVIGNF